MCRVVQEIVDGDGNPLVACCYVADRPPARLVGLLGTPDLTQDEGLWLEPCSSVHTWGMRISIACAFLDAGGRVLRVVDPLPPWRHVAVRGARAVVEVRPGRLPGVIPGTSLRRLPPTEMSA